MGGNNGVEESQRHSGIDLFQGNSAPLTGPCRLPIADGRMVGETVLPFAHWLNLMA